MTRIYSPYVAPDPARYRPENWRDSAACRNHPALKPSSWDDAPEGREDPQARAVRVKAATWVCRNECPVLASCAADIDLRTDSGVRGGEDLRVLRERRAG